MCKDLRRGSHTDACHERFRELIHNEKLAKVAKEKGLAAPDTPVPTVLESAPKTPAIQAQAEKFLDAEALFASCHLAPGEVDAKGGKDVSNEKLGDYWEYDQTKSAWTCVHVRPRKRLYAPVGKDCPFDAKDILPDRLTEWKCKGVTSVYRGQLASPPTPKNFIKKLDRLHLVLPFTPD